MLLITITWWMIPAMVTVKYRNWLLSMCGTFQVSRVWARMLWRCSHIDRAVKGAERMVSLLMSRLGHHQKWQAFLQWEELQSLGAATTPWFGHMFIAVGKERTVVLYRTLYSGLDHHVCVRSQIWRHAPGLDVVAGRLGWTMPSMAAYLLDHME